MNKNVLEEKYPFAFGLFEWSIDLLIDIAKETDGYTQIKVTKKTGEIWTITVQEIKEDEEDD